MSIHIEKMKPALPAAALAVAVLLAGCGEAKAAPQSATSASPSVAAGESTVASGEEISITAGETVWITVAEGTAEDWLASSTGTQAGAAARQVYDNFRYAQVFHLLADGTWRCEAQEGALYYNASGTWEQDTEGRIQLTYPDGGTEHRYFAIEDPDPADGVSTLETSAGETILCRVDTTEGAAAYRLYQQALEGLVGANEETQYTRLAILTPAEGGSTDTVMVDDVMLVTAGDAGAMALYGLTADDMPDGYALVNHSAAPPFYEAPTYYSVYDFSNISLCAKGEGEAAAVTLEEFYAALQEQGAIVAKVTTDEGPGILNTAVQLTAAQLAAQ